MHTVAGFKWLPSQSRGPADDWCSVAGLRLMIANDLIPAFSLSVENGWGKDIPQA